MPQMKLINLREQEVPRWILVTITIMGAAMIVFGGWHVFRGTEAEPGPRIEVHPNMYNLQQAAQPHAAAPQTPTSGSNQQ
jgi:hypothetical protein